LGDGTRDRQHPVARRTHTSSRAGVPGQARARLDEGSLHAPFFIIR
jgi:hypothetical protein